MPVALRLCSPLRRDIRVQTSPRLTSKPLKRGPSYRGALNRYTLTFKRLIFESSVRDGRPSLVAAPFGPDTRPLLAASAAYGQVPGAGRGAAPPLGATPKAAIPNVKPVRSCESLAMLALPNTTIESAAVDPVSPGLCRVTAVTTHPPAGDKVRIWVGIPTANWNGRFLGNGGGGFRASLVFRDIVSPIMDLRDRKWTLGSRH